jgi:hypothetical protein
MMSILEFFLPIFAGLACAAILAGCAQAALPPANTPVPTPSPTPAPLNTLETIIQDSTLPHEGRPHGVDDSVDWSQTPRIGMGNDPGNFRAMTAWGQLYMDRAGSSATNTRVQIRNIRAYSLSKRDGQWHVWQSSTSVDGAAYREDFAGDVNIPALARAEAGGGLSVKLVDGYNYHFWPTSDRASFDPQDIAGVFTTVQARLVIDDPQKPDDRDQARLLLCMGGDYWLNTTAQWDKWKTNGDIAIARFKYVKKGWQAFNMTTLSAEDLRKNPPPLE